MSSTIEFISEHVLNAITITCVRVVDPLLQVFGLAVNLINLFTYKAIGLKDSMNISFWVLSLSDFMYLFCCAVYIVCFIIAMSPLQLQISINMFTLVSWLGWYQYIFLDTSTCIETYIAVARCCCVAMPLKFKNVFTARRTLLFCACAFIVNAALHIPALSTHGLNFQLNPVANSSQFTMSNGPLYSFFFDLEKVLARTILPTTFLVIAIVCSFILSISLFRASRRRSEMTSQRKNIKKNKRGKMTSLANPTGHFSDRHRLSYCGPDHNMSVKKPSSKELQVVKAVTVVTIFLGFSLLVSSVCSLAEVAEPEFYPGRKYTYLHAFIMTLSNIVVTCHVSGKVFIYCSFNKRFRETVITSLCCVLKRFR